MECFYMNQRRILKQLQSGYPIKYKKDKKRKCHLMLSFFWLIFIFFVQDREIYCKNV